MSAVLEVRNLTKDYGDLRALDEVTLDVTAGELVVLIGPNGSGKTTLIRLIAGLLEPTAGSALVVGSPAGSLAARAAVSYIPDAPVLYDDLSVLEHLEYVARLHGVMAWQSHASKLLDVLGLSARSDDLPATFSRGLRQKTAIAVALVRPYDLLLVDEPFAGIDAAGRRALEVLLAESVGAGAAVVVATHQFDYARAARRCIAFSDGRVAYDGDPTDALETVSGSSASSDEPDV